MPKLQKLILTALLTILITQNCSGDLKVWSSNGQLNYPYHISTCQNLFPEFIGSTQAAKTDKCLILFSEANCVGYEYQLVPGFYFHLLSFADRAVSFEPCRSNMYGIEEYAKPEAWFSYKCAQPSNDSYDPDDYTMCSLPLEKISRSCQNLNWGFRRSGLAAVNTSKCILSFSEENCEGNGKAIRIGHTILNYPDSRLRNLVKSYRICFNERNIQNRIKFYSQPNFTEIIDDVALQSGCNTKFYLNYKTVYSMETPACVKLFQTFDCSGYFRKIIPGSSLSSSSSLNFPFKGEAVKSLMQCNDEPSEENENISEYLEEIDDYDYSYGNSSNSWNLPGMTSYLFIIVSAIFYF